MNLNLFKTRLPDLKTEITLHFKLLHQLLNYKRFNKVIEALNLNKIVNIEFYFGQNPNVKNAF